VSDGGIFANIISPSVNKKFTVGCQVITAVNVEITVAWDMTSSSLTAVQCVAATVMINGIIHVL